LNWYKKHLSEITIIFGVIFFQSFCKQNQCNWFWSCLSLLF